MQVGDHIDPVFWLLQADKAHLGARNVLLGFFHELINMLVVPDWLLAAKLGHAGRIGKAPMAAGLASDNAPQVRACAIGTAIVSIVTGLALLEDGFPGLHVSGGQNRSPIWGNIGHNSPTSTTCIGDFDRVAGFGRCGLFEHGRRQFLQTRDGKGRHKDGTGDFIERQVAHNPEFGPLIDRRIVRSKRGNPRPVLRQRLLHATGPGATGQLVQVLGI